MKLTWKGQNTRCSHQNEFIHETRVTLFKLMNCTDLRQYSYMKQSSSKNNANTLVRVLRNCVVLKKSFRFKSLRKNFMCVYYWWDSYASFQKMGQKVPGCGLIGDGDCYFNLLSCNFIVSRLFSILYDAPGSVGSRKVQGRHYSYVIRRGPLLRLLDWVTELLVCLYPYHLPPPLLKNFDFEAVSSCHRFYEILNFKINVILEVSMERYVLCFSFCLLKCLKSTQRCFI